MEWIWIGGEVRRISEELREWIPYSEYGVYSVNSIFDKIKLLKLYVGTSYQQGNKDEICVDNKSWQVSSKEGAEEGDHCYLPLILTLPVLGGKKLQLSHTRLHLYLSSSLDGSCLWRDKDKHRERQRSFHSLNLPLLKARKDPGVWDIEEMNKNLWGCEIHFMSRKPKKS